MKSDQWREVVLIDARNHQGCALSWLLTARQYLTAADPSQVHADHLEAMRPAAAEWCAN